MLVSKAIELDYGHTLPNHFSFCNQIHGHRAKIVAYVDGKLCQTKNDSSQGMVMDFKIIKDLMMDRIHKVLDHGFAVWMDDIETKNYITRRNQKYLITLLPPTAEVLAQWAYKQMIEGLAFYKDNAAALGDEAGRHSLIHLEKVEWYETPTSIAVYTSDDFLVDQINIRQ
jgi:6-pyruvoyltetrahydropterin/6-carboxytetrahydropterin synthase